MELFIFLSFCSCSSLLRSWSVFLWLVSLINLWMETWLLVFKLLLLLFLKIMNSFKQGWLFGSSWGTNWLFRIMQIFLGLKWSFFYSMDHRFLNFPGYVPSLGHSSLKLSLFSGLSHSFNSVHNRSLINLVWCIFCSNWFFLNVWMESQLFSIFLEFNFFSRFVWSFLLLSFNESKLVKIKTFISSSFMNSIWYLTFFFSFPFFIYSFRSIIINLWMECTILSLFFFELSFCFLNPLLFICGCSQNVKTSDFLSIVCFCNSFSIIFRIFNCFIWNLRFECAVLCHFLSSLFSSWLLSKADESNSIEVEELKMLWNFSTIRIEITIFSLSKLFWSFSSDSVSNFNSFNCY